MTPWADDVGSRQGPVAVDRGVEVAGPGDQLARSRTTRPDAEGIEAARGSAVAAVGDVVEQAAGEVSVAVAVHVAVRRRGCLGDGLLVVEAMVVVEVDVHGVVDAGRGRVGDQERRPLAEQLEQVIVRVAAEANVAGFAKRLPGTGRCAASFRPATPKLRDGPVLVENLTGHVAWGALLAQSVQVAAVVSTYHDRPWSIWEGAASHWSVPNGSKAFGQPFQPARAPGLSGPGLPRPEEVGVPEVRAAIEDADGHAGAGVAGLPCRREVVRLGVEERQLLERLEVRARERRRLRVRDFLVVQALERFAQHGLARRLARFEIAERPARLLEVDRADRHHAVRLRELGQGLHGDLAHDEGDAIAFSDVGIGRSASASAVSPDTVAKTRTAFVLPASTCFTRRGCSLLLAASEFDTTFAGLARLGSLALTAAGTTAPTTRHAMTRNAPN